MPVTVAEGETSAPESNPLADAEAPDLRHLFRHGSVYLIGAVSSQLIGFFLIPLYTHYLTPADYGILEILERGLAVLGILGGLGLARAVVRYYFEQTDDDYRRRVLATASLTVLASSLGLAAVVVALSPWLSVVLLKTSSYAYLVTLTAIGIGLEVACAVPMAAMRAREQSTAFITFSLIRLLMGVGLNIWFLAGLHLGLVGILYSSVIVNLVTGAVMFGLLLRESGLRFDRAVQRDMLRFGAPVAPGGIPMLALHYGDRFILQRLASNAAVGIYSLGYRFGSVLGTLINNPFGLVWDPYMYKVAGRPSAGRIYGRVLTYHQVITMAGALCLTLLAPDLIRLMADRKFWAASELVGPVAFGYAVYGAYNVTFSGIVITKRTGWLPLLSTVAALVNIGANFLLIPRYGAMGAAFATLISFAWLTVTTGVVSQRKLPVVYEARRLFHLYLVVGACLAMGLLLPRVAPGADVWLRVGALVLLPVALMATGFPTAEERTVLRGLRDRALRRLRSGPPAEP
jgi:O-antigen/teichoic acid export membrane protein